MEEASKRVHKKKTEKYKHRRIDAIDLIGNAAGIDNIYSMHCDDR